MKKCYLLEDTEVNLQLCANCLRSGACNNIPQPGWREPQTLISHSPEAGCLRPGACVVGWWCLHCSWGADGCLLCVLAGGRGREGARPASAHKDTSPSCNSTLRISSKLVTSRRPHLQIPAPQSFHIGILGTQTFSPQQSVGEERHGCMCMCDRKLLTKAITDPKLLHSYRVLNSGMVSGSFQSCF